MRKIKTPVKILIVLILYAIYFYLAFTLLDALNVPAVWPGTR